MFKYRIIVAGSRDFTDYQYLSDALKYYLGELECEDICIISGGARGADTLGERFAKEHQLAYMVIPARWNEYGKSAGYKRNILMAEQATHLIAFHKNGSKGTQHMINIAEKHNLNIRVCKL